MNYSDFGNPGSPVYRNDNPGSPVYRNDIPKDQHMKNYDYGNPGSPLNQAGANINDQGMDRYFNAMAYKISEDEPTVNQRPPNPPLPKKLPPSNLDNELSRAAHQMNLERAQNKSRTQGNDLLQQRLSGGSNLDLMKMSGLPPEQLFNLRHDLSHNDSRRSFSIGGLRRKPQILACFQNRSLLPCCPWCTKCVIYTLGVILIVTSAILLIGLFILSTYVDNVLDIGDVFVKDEIKNDAHKKALKVVKRVISNTILNMTDEIKIVLFIIIVTIVGIFVSLSCRLQIFLYLYALCQFLIGLILYTQIRRIGYLNVESITEQILLKGISQFQYKNCDYCIKTITSPITVSDVIGEIMMKHKCCGVRSYAEFYSKDEPPGMCCKEFRPCKKKSDNLYPGCYDFITNLTEFKKILKYKRYIDLTRFSLLAAGYIYTTIYVAMSIIVIVNGVTFIIDNVTIRNSFIRKSSSRHSGSLRDQRSV